MLVNPIVCLGKALSDKVYTKGVWFDGLETVPVPNDPATTPPGERRGLDSTFQRPKPIGFFQIYTCDYSFAVTLQLLSATTENIYVVFMVQLKKQELR